MCACFLMAYIGIEWLIFWVKFSIYHCTDVRVGRIVRLSLESTDDDLRLYAVFCPGFSVYTPTSHLDSPRIQHQPRPSGLAHELFCVTRNLRSHSRRNGFRSFWHKEDRRYLACSDDHWNFHLGNEQFSTPSVYWSSYFRCRWTDVSRRVASAAVEMVYR